MNGRIYDPTLGRFLQADPHIQAPNNSQSYNRYSYVLNNPMSYTDPSGYFFDKLFRPFKNVIRGVFKAIGQEASQWLVNIASIACGPAYAACVAVGNYDIARAFGANRSGALRGAFTAGVIAYINGPPQGINVIQVAAEIIDPDVARVVRFLQNGIDIESYRDSVLQGLRESVSYIAHETKNHYVSKELARFAHKNGMSLPELNALLAINSFVGNKVAGSRYKEDRNEISGFNSRTRGLLGVIWDVNDTILGYQGLLDASGHEYITGSKADQAISGCHSLGTLTCNNLVGRGHAPSAQLNSLPFGNIAVGKNALTTNLGQLDIINGGWLGRIFNPISTSTLCLDGGTSGMFCHGWDANYRPIQNGAE